MSNDKEKSGERDSAAEPSAFEIAASDFMKDVAADAEIELTALLETLNNEARADAVLRERERILGGLADLSWIFEEDDEVKNDAVLVSEVERLVKGE
jgi:hypothetical protein